MLLIERYPKNNPVAELFKNRDMPEAERQKRVKQAIDLARSSGVTEQCHEVASGYCARACRRLRLLPDSPSRQALEDLADLVISRKS
jgi:geranylgeranyl pyrophosphate synthase